MVSTQTYDIMVLLGVIILIAVIIFWSVRYGAAVVSDIMLEAPIVLQSSFASYGSAMCGVDGDAYVSHGLVKQYPLYAFMNASHVQIRPAEKRYYPYADTERGGYIGFGIRPALPFVNCRIDVIRKNVRFNQNVHKGITLNKTEGRMQIGVK